MNPIYNVCLIQPAQYEHSKALLELAELIHFSIRQLGKECALSSNHVPHDRINIILGAHLLGLELRNQIPNSSIIFNTEQLSDETAQWTQVICEWGRHFEIWDYSLKNIEFFKQVGLLNTKHFKIGYQRELERIKFDDDRPIDVLFYGSLNERRIQILKSLEAEKVIVKTLFGVYGAQRDEWIAKSKVVLNMHYYQSALFEIVRTFYLLTNQVAVVSERGDVTTLDSHLEEGLCLVPYESIVAQCLSLLSDPQERSTVARRGYEHIQKFPQSNFTRELVS
jgi:hypothetical protein